MQELRPVLGVPRALKQGPHPLTEREPQVGLAPGLRAGPWCWSLRWIPEKAEELEPGEPAACGQGHVRGITCPGEVISLGQPLLGS